MTILHWTSPRRAKKMITKRRKVVTAADFNQGIRDQAEIREELAPPWPGHIGDPNRFEPSCGCRKCTAARFDMTLGGM